MSEKHPYRGQTEISKGGEPVRFGGVECWWDENAKHYAIGDDGMIQRLMGGAGSGWLAVVYDVTRSGRGDTPQAAADDLFRKLRRVRDELDALLGPKQS